MDITKELKKDGMLLKKIPKKEQTIDICKMAIRQNPLALQFVSRKCLDSKMCLAAVKKDGQAFRYVPSQFITRKMCELAVEADPELLNNVPENFRTLRICINAIKKDVSTLSYVSREKRYELFDNNTEIDLIKKVVEHNSKWLMYMPNRPDVRAFCISCMEEDFSVAQYMPEQIKIVDDILNYQKTKGKLHFIHKYYNSEEGKFCVKIKVVCGQHASIFDENEMIEESYCVVMEFGDFDKFYSFLDGDLFDAELRNFDFKGIDLKQYNIDGATINSEILQLQGLYDGTYFSSIKKILETDSDEFMGSNEIMIPIDIQHIGSTAIPAIKAKPIIDIVVGVTDFDKVMLHNEQLRQVGIFYCGSDVERQLLYVMGDMENDTRTHHIHIVKWNGTEWKNYIHFRDYLNDNENMALQYQKVKEELESKYADDRVAYTNGKQDMIDLILDNQ